MTKRVNKQGDGYYHINGKTYKNLIGSRKQVWDDTAFKTTGNLQRCDILLNRWGRLVSYKKNKKEHCDRRLQKYGWTAKKGKFGAVRMSAIAKSTSKSKSD